ncbi:hypothetical protein FRC19_008192 [Serendipita sp. 401]|nr:hypothetical protein FRC19_008192 [Serendipita sp. 401]
MVLANKADALQSDTEAEVEESRAKLAKLKEEAISMWNKGPNVEGRSLEVVAASAKYTQNLAKVVKLLGAYVKEARAAEVAGVGSRG